VFVIVVATFAILGSLLLACGIYAAIADAVVGAKARNPEGDSVRRNGAWMLAGAVLLVMWYFGRFVG
jgi:hypothetical protein